MARAVCPHRPPTPPSRSQPRAISASRDDRRVQPAAEQGAHRHIRAQVRGHGFPHNPADISARGSRINGNRCPPPHHSCCHRRRGAKIQFQHLPRANRADAREERALPECRADGGEVRTHRQPVRARGNLRVGENRARLAGEDKRRRISRIRPPVQRLDPQRVAGQQQPMLERVVDRQGVHAAEPRGAVGPRLRHDRQHGLRVTARAESDASRVEVRAQFRIVVQLAVVGDDKPAIGGRHRLRAIGRWIDDGQTPVRKHHRAVR